MGSFQANFATLKVSCSQIEELLRMYGQGHSAWRQGAFSVG